MINEFDFPSPKKIFGFPSDGVMFDSYDAFFLSDQRDECFCLMGDDDNCEMKKLNEAVNR